MFANMFDILITPFSTGYLFRYQGKDFSFFSFTINEKRLYAIEVANVNTTSEWRTINREKMFPLRGRSELKRSLDRGGNGVAAVLERRR